MYDLIIHTFGGYVNSLWLAFVGQVKDHNQPFYLKALMALGFAGLWPVSFWFSYWDSTVSAPPTRSGSENAPNAL